VQTVILAFVMFVGTILQLVGRWYDRRWLAVVGKPAASAAFVIIGFVRWTSGDWFGTCMVGALVLCLAGDLFLLCDRTFFTGLVAFLAGHLAYLAAFHIALPVSSWSPLLLAPLAAVSLAVSWWLRPHLKAGRVRVYTYIAVISVMVWGAVASSFGDAVRWTAGVGAILFYLSDLAVARQRFVQPAFANRAFGLPAYYLGQLLLALAIGGTPS
jgi:uncharacterized membrane protein YhhN